MISHRSCSAHAIFASACRLLLSRLLGVLLLLLTASAIKAQNWIYAPNLPIPLDLEAAAKGPDGKIYAIGGEDSQGNARSTVQAYDPASNTWTTAAYLNTARWGLAAATGEDGTIYAIGGTDHLGITTGSTFFSVVEAYNPANNKWTPVASLNIARTGLAAATGPDGTVYAIGGTDSDGNVLSSVEAYDPITNTWTPVASLNTARINLAAATGPDGKIYAIGGSTDYFGDNILSSVEAYDPITDTWTPVASLNIARTGLAAAIGPDGKIYAIGGEDSEGYVLSSVEAYDPITNTWTSAPSLNTSRTGLAAATGPDGKIYAIGGADGNGDNTGDVEAYGQKWTYVAPLPKARAHLAAATGPDGQPYAIGGEGSGNALLSDVNVYDPGSEAWNDLSPLHVPRGLLAAATGLNGGIYAIGGVDSHDKVSSVVELYSIIPHTWKRAAGLNTARYDLAAATGPDSKVYAIGGMDSNFDVSSFVEAYDTHRNIWEYAASLNTPRAELAAVTGPDGRIYAIGGEDSNGNPIATVEAYNLVSDTWTPAASLNTARWGLAAVMGPDGRIYAFGGIDSSGQASEVMEVYDPWSDTWTVADNLFAATALLAAASDSDGYIYAIGGADSNDDLVPTVEAFFVETLPIRLTVTPSPNSGVARLTLGGPAPPTGLLAQIAGAADTTLFVAPGATTGSATIPYSVPYGLPVTLAATYQGRTVYTGFTVPYPKPTLTAVAPNAITAGSGDTVVTLTGTGFGVNTTAEVNGQSVSTTYAESPRSLTAKIPAADLVGTGKLNLTVHSPAPGGGVCKPIDVSLGVPKMALGGFSGARNSDGSVTIRFKLTNTARFQAPATEITFADVGTVATSTTLPLSLGTLSQGQSATATLNFPASVGTKGTKTTLTFGGTYTGGTWTDTRAIIVP